MIKRYQTRAIAQGIEAVLWNGTNLMEVQAVCPQVKANGTTLSIPIADGTSEVYVGEVVARDLTTGKCSKMKLEFLNAFYEGQIL